MSSMGRSGGIIGKRVGQAPGRLIRVKSGGSWLGDTASFGHLCETVIFGPGGEPVYQPNESLALSDIEAATRIYALTAAKILEAA